MNEAEARLEFAVDLAKRAGELALGFFRDLENLTIESKGHQDLVSNGDKEVELFVRAEIAKAYPDDGIIGEEHAPAEGTTGDIWVIDPIDGTANFVRGIPQWCVIISCARDGVPHTGAICEPASGETFYARRGGGAFCNGRPISVSTSTSVRDGSIGVGFNTRTTRPDKIMPVLQAIVENGGVFFRNASGGLMLCYVAAGRLIAYTEDNMNAWDCLAGLLLIEEAGGIVEPCDTGDILKKGTVALGGAPGVFDWVRGISAGPYGLP